MAAEDELEALKRGKRWSDVLEVLTRRAAHESDPTTAIESWNEAGKLALARFGNQREALRCFEASLALDPAQQEIREAALALYRKRRDWAHIARHTRDEQERADAQSRLEGGPWRRIKALFGPSR